MKKFSLFLLSLICISGFFSCVPDEVKNEHKIEQAKKNKLIYGADLDNEEIKNENTISDDEFKYPLKKEIEVWENTVRKIGDENLKFPVELSDEDAKTLSQIIENGAWESSDSYDCPSDYSINLRGFISYYHSECGTFTKIALPDNPYISSIKQDVDITLFILSEEDKTAVNEMLEKYCH